MYENKISARQLRRMIFIETFGAGALSIPAFACYKEQNGFWSLIFYGVFLAGTIAFFIIFSGKISEENFENRKIGKTGKFSGSFTPANKICIHDSFFHKCSSTFLFLW